MSSNNTKKPINKAYRSILLKTQNVFSLNGKINRVLSIFISTLILLSITVVPAIAASSGNEKVPVIILFKDKPDAALVRSLGGDVKQQYTIIKAISADLPANAIDALSRNPKIEIIEPDLTVYAMGQVTPWGIERIGAPAVHTNSIDGTGINVAIIDTGIDYTHPDLAANYIGGYDFVNDDNDPMDDQGHGTHVAGIVAAIDNGIGVIGAAPEVNLYGVKVLSSSGSGSYSDIISGIQWAVNNNMDIASMSLGGTYNLASLEAACNNAYASGVVIVAAAGNGYGAAVIYPAAYDSVIAVSAIYSSNTVASFSNIGPQIELTAPGYSIMSTLVGGTYGTKSGTSMATPHVTGAAALLLSTSVSAEYDLNGNGQWDPAEVRQRLQDTATDLGVAGKDDYYGYGLVNAEAAIEAPIETPIETPIPEDTTAPIITLLGSNTVTIEVGEVYTDAGATASDNYDGDLTNSILTVNTVDNTTVGTYSVTYDVTDSSLNRAAQVTRTVYVEDTTPVEPIPPADEYNLHISDITVTSDTKKAGKNVFKWAIATVTVVDDDGVPVPGAEVSGSWSGLVTDSDISITNADGMVTVNSNSIKSPASVISGTFTFTVIDVTLTGWKYDVTAENSGSITI